MPKAMQGWILIVIVLIESSAKGAIRAFLFNGLFGAFLVNSAMANADFKASLWLHLQFQQNSDIVELPIRKKSQEKLIDFL